METIAQKALRLLEPIPEDKFITGQYTNEVDSCCSMGHFNRLTGDSTEDYSGYNCCLSKDGILLYKAGTAFRDTIANPITEVNDRETAKYSEPTSKFRVIHLLQDMIQAGY